MAVQRRDVHLPVSQLRHSRQEAGFQTLHHVPVCVQFWTHASRTPQEWLDALDAFTAQPFVRRVFLLGIPTARINAVHTAKGYPEVGTTGDQCAPGQMPQLERMAGQCVSTHCCGKCDLLTLLATSVSMVSHAVARRRTGTGIG